MGIQNLEGVEKYHKTKNGTHSKSQYNGKKVINTKKEAIEAMDKMKNVLGYYPKTGNEWNNNRSEIGIGTRAGVLGRNTGYTFNEIKEICNADNINKYNHFKPFDVYRDFIKAAEKYGKDFKRDEFNNDDELISRAQAERIVELNFNQIKDKLGLKTNMSSYTEKEIKQELRKIKGNITAEKINNQCSFSSSVVGKYGNGTLINGLKYFDINITSRQNWIHEGYKSRDDTTSYIKKELNQINSYDNSADGYIYVLLCTHISTDSEYYYIGNIRYDNSLLQRIKNHISLNGAFSHPLYGSELETQFSINNIVKIQSYNKTTTESINEFNDKLNNKEREMAYKIAIEYETVNILGGK